MKRQQYTILFPGLAITLLCAACHQTAEVPAAISVTEATTGLANATPTVTPTAVPTVTPSLEPDVPISTSGAGSPTRLDDRPLCGLTVTEEDTPWRQVGRIDYEAGGIRDLIRDGDWLWVSTPVDVVRLDLHTLDCTRFSHTVGDPEVELSGIRNLLFDPDGRLWAAAGANLVRFDGQRWQAFPTKGPGCYVSNLSFDTAGNLWTDISLVRGGTFRVQGLETFRYPGHEPPEEEPWEGESDLPPAKYDCDQWFSRGGEFRSPEECRLLADWRKHLASLTPPEGIAPWGKEPPPLIAAEANERLWMLAHYHLLGETGPYDALLSFDGENENWQVLAWPYGSARLVADEARGGVWAGTDEGLVFSDGQSIQEYPLLPGDVTSVGPMVYDLVTDGSGRLWVSTSGGLLRYDEALDVWQRTEVIDWRLLISADDRGGLWVVPRDRSGRVSYFDGETWTHHSFLSMRPCYPESILAAAGGGLWLSSFDCALRRFNGGVWDEYDSGSRGDLLARGLGGTVYAAARDGAIKQCGGTTWETLPPVELPHLTQVTDITVGPEGEVWVVIRSSSPAVYRGGEWEKFPELADKVITALMVDSRGGVWASDNLWASHSQGLLHYDGETWERIEREIPFSTINALAEDRQGRIWVGGRDGLSVYDPRGK